MPVVGIPYAPMPASQSPNISTHSRADDVYMRSSFVALASFTRWNPDWDCVLFTSEQPSAFWAEKFSSIGVDRIIVEPFKHFPPSGFAPTFAGALYLLDAVDTLAKDDYLLLIDPDVIAVASVNAILEDTASVAALALHHRPEDDINRLTLAGASRIHASLGEPRESVVHYGGEFYGIPAALRGLLQQRVDAAWEESLRGFAEGREFFTTEEHVMSFALAGMPVRESSDIIRRIWTSHSFRTVNGQEANLAMWHLPAEKERSIAVAYEAAIDPMSWFWTDSDAAFKDRFGRLAGMSHRSTLRYLQDTAGRGKRIAQRALGKL